MTTEVLIVALLGFFGNIIASWLGVNKQAALFNQRLDYLEDKVNKHNQLVERTYKLESDMRTAFLRIDEINEKIEK